MTKPQEITVWKLLRVGAAPNPTALTHRARTFAASLRSVGCVSLVTLRDDSGMSHFVSLPDVEGADVSVVQIAQAVASRAEETPAMPSLSTPYIGRLVVRSGSVAVRDPQTGVDPSELVRRIAVAMRSGAWVGVSCRSPRGNEDRRVRRWYGHRLGAQLPVHHSSDEHPLIISVWAGAETPRQIQQLLDQTEAAMPGFDVGVSVKMISGVRRRVGIAVSAFMSLAALVAVRIRTPLDVAWWTIAIAGVAAALVIRATITDSLPSQEKKVRRALDNGYVPAPPRRRFRPSPPHKEKELGNGRTRSESEGAYPLARSSFLVGPSVVVGVVAPHAGAASGAASTEAKSAPAVLLSRIGPAVGTVGENSELVYIDAASMWGGVSMVGLPGSGKSALLRAVFGWNCLERVAPTGQENWPGASNTLVAFESKGDGAELYMKWSRTIGDRTALIQVAQPDGWAIDLFAVPGGPADKASFFVNAMSYAFGADAIGDRSFESLLSVLTAALAMGEECAVAGGIPANRSVLVRAHVLLGGQGDPKAVALAEALSEAVLEAQRTGDGRSVELAEGEAALAALFGTGVTRAQRRQLCEAPRNKLVQLLGAESWWSPQRRKVTWDQILDGHRSVVINTGITTSGFIVDDRLSAQMSAMLMYSLREAIKRRCSGWQAQGRSVTIFADELSLVAGSSPEVVTWFRNQGRSYGVRPVFATQYPEQLPEEVRAAFLSFGTTFWFAQSNAQIATAAAVDLSLSGEKWTADQIAGLEKHVAVLQATVDQKRQPPVPVNITYWEDDMWGYPEKQGWT